jgi:3-dehydroquinate dehydratase / shikimate dehydrogenase
MKLIATIYEPTLEGALGAIAALPAAVDGIELRADRLDRALGGGELGAVRAATEKLLIFTRRSHVATGKTNVDELRSALGAGFDLVDVELSPALDRPLVEPIRDRVILSHHDFEATPELDLLVDSMAAFGAAHVKIAATPHSFADNERLLAILESHRERVDHLTIIGMGTAGLYERILAPWFGSELVFVAVGAGSVAAPAQLTLDRALEIYGERRALETPGALFAVVGDPAAHSLSPSIHNAIFRERGVAAAYSIIDTSDFDAIFEELARGSRFAPAGLSVTAPFKERAYHAALRSGGEIGEHARAARSANTLIRRAGSVLADNTDVDAFEGAIAKRKGRSAAVIGAGGTARAAIVALRGAGIRTTLFNRTDGKAAALAKELGVHAAPFRDLSAFKGDVVVNTVTAGADLRAIEPLLGRTKLYVEAGYGQSGSLVEAARAAGAETVDGLEILRLQARRQSEMFLESISNECEVREVHG